MHQLAEQLNQALPKVIAQRLLTDFGRRIYFPKGVAAQTEEARQRATRLNATIGMAMQEGSPLMLSSIAEHIRGMPPEDSVSYAPTRGVAALRTRWQEIIMEKNRGLASSEALSCPIVVPGLTAGLAICADLFIEPDDVVMLPDMFWGNYTLMMGVRRQAHLQTYPLFNEAGGFNVDGLEALLERQQPTGKAIVLLNFPNNPSGYSLTVAEVKALLVMLKRMAERGMALLALIDDAYFGLWYEAALYRQSLFVPLSTLHENLLAIKVDGATKEDYAWGLRVAFLTAGGAGLQSGHYRALESKIAGSLRSAISNCSMVGQQLLLRALNSPGYHSEKERYFQQLQMRYRRVRAILARRDSPELFQVMPYNSAYYVCLQCQDFDAQALRESLLTDGIGVIAMNNYIRVAYSNIDLEHLEGLFEAIWHHARRVAKQ